MEIIVGRKGQQKTVINDMTVSREHCKLTSQPDGTFILENLSSNGTFINGNKVLRTVVTRDTILQLGTSFNIAVKDLIPEVSQTAQAHNSAQKTQQQECPTENIKHLKAIYDKYSADKIRIQKEAGMNNFYRMLPMTLLSLVGLVSAVIPAMGSVAPFLGIGGVILLIYSISKSYSCSKENPEKMEALNRQFMIDYVCPKCKNFLGFVPYETLKNKGKCSFCKCNWK